jgi:hypothetical protein
MTKMISRFTRIDWIEDAAYDPLLPSAALFSNATNISCAIKSGYSLNPTKSDVNDARTICEMAKVENPIRYNYEGNLTFFREGDLAETTSAFARAFDFFKSSQNKKTGYLVRRTGYLNTVAVAVGHKVDSFKFTNDNPQDVIDNDLIEFSVKFLQQGNMELDKAVVA